MGGGRGKVLEAGGGAEASREKGNVAYEDVEGENETLYCSIYRG